jgi:hypothetical protein
MNETKKRSIAAITRGFIAADNSHVEVHLAVIDENEKELIISMTPRSLSQVVSHLTEMDSAVQIQIGSTTGHVATEAADVTAVMAQEAVGGSKVIVSFRTSVGRVQSFALSMEQAQQLRMDARKAEGRAREQASKSRN